MSLYKTLTEEQKQKSRSAALKWYHNNKEKAAQKAKKWREENRQYILDKQRLDKRKRKDLAIEYLGGKCSQCLQIVHPSAYEFHHTDPSTKDRDPSKMLQLSWKRLSLELDKCVLVCANCHRFLHYGDVY